MWSLHLLRCVKLVKVEKFSSWRNWNIEENGSQKPSRYMIPTRTWIWKSATLKVPTKSPSSKSSPSSSFELWKSNDQWIKLSLISKIILAKTWVLSGSTCIQTHLFQTLLRTRYLEETPLQRPRRSWWLSGWTWTCHRFGLGLGDATLTNGKSWMSRSLVFNSYLIHTRCSTHI